MAWYRGLPHNKGCHLSLLLLLLLLLLLVLLLLLRLLLDKQVSLGGSANGGDRKAVQELVWYLQSPEVDSSMRWLLA